MTENDVEYFYACHRSGLVKAPFLEFGAAKVQGPSVPNLCEIARSLGVNRTLGADIQTMTGVDVVADLSLDRLAFAQQWTHGQFETVAIFNVLEHVFDPITVLTNALACASPTGHILIVTPVIWPLHAHPGDFSRLLPNWYQEFARRSGASLIPEHCKWITEFGVAAADLELAEIPDWRIAAPRGVRQAASMVVHRVFNTYGRSHRYAHTALGIAMTAAQASSPSEPT